MQCRPPYATLNNGFGQFPSSCPLASQNLRPRAASQRHQHFLCSFFRRRFDFLDRSVRSPSTINYSKSLHFREGDKIPKLHLFRTHIVGSGQRSNALMMTDNCRKENFPPLGVRAFCPAHQQVTIALSLYKFFFFLDTGTCLLPDFRGFSGYGEVFFCYHLNPPHRDRRSRRCRNVSRRGFTMTINEGDVSFARGNRRGARGRRRKSLRCGAFAPPNEPFSSDSISEGFDGKN